MTIKNLRIHFQGKTYDLAVETLGEPSAPAFPAPTLRAVPPPPPVAAPVDDAPPPPPAAAPVEAPAPAAAGKGTPITAPLSGTVVDVHVQVGQAVKYGDLLVTVEAMKMNTAVRATCAGTVTAVAARKGSTVAEGTALVTIG
jgi:pyruvate dehydrogenase E2 component (dihydrolipoamide acetyltransferase)